MKWKDPPKILRVSGIGNYAIVDDELVELDMRDEETRKLVELLHRDENDIG